MSTLVIIASHGQRDRNITNIHLKMNEENRKYRAYSKWNIIHKYLGRRKSRYRLNR